VITVSFLKKKKKKLKHIDIIRLGNSKQLITSIINNFISNRGLKLARIPAANTKIEVVKNIILLDI